ncbi:MAG: tetratricopeptide repeat protein [Pirellulaceae bacterium]
MSAWVFQLGGLLAMGAAVGCASGQTQLAPEPSLSASRAERRGELVEQFEAARDEAQLQAALDRWQQGDVAGCESRLRAIVARRPDWVEPHIYLAELAWSFDNTAEALQQYRAALQLEPQRAELHHALALVLEATGQPGDAQHHFDQASRLEPDNKLYRLAGQSVPPVDTASTLPVRL